MKLSLGMQNGVFGCSVCNERCMMYAPGCSYWLSLCGGGKVCLLWCNSLHDYRAVGMALAYPTIVT